MTEPEATTDRHASWLELFFDLVVVVAVNQLAHLLHAEGHHGPDGLAITTFVTLYLAIWLVWTTFTLYSNVVADKVRVRAMFAGMGGIAVMAATVPEGMGARSTLFAAAFLITAAIGANSLTRSGKMLLSWGAATRNAGLAPWVASFWVHHPWWRLGLWITGLTMTLLASVGGSRADADEMITRYNERVAQRVERIRDPQRRAQLREQRPVLVAASVDPAHLGERLGLFVIIVLGEAMLQLVGAASEVESWRPRNGAGYLLMLAAAAGFALLIVVWRLNVRYGFAQVTRFSPALLLPIHFAVIASITIIAAGLGVATAHAADHLPTSSAWLTCAATTVFLALITAMTHRFRSWTLTVAAHALPVAAAILSPLLPAAVIVTTLVAATIAQLYNLQTRPEEPPTPSE